ncbi:MAG: porin family protein [Bacteroidota bacterium]
MRRWTLSLEVTRGLLLLMGVMPLIAQAQYNWGVFGGSIATEFSGIQSDDARFGFDIGYNLGAQFDYYVERDVALSLGLTFKDERGSVSLLDDTDPDDTFLKDSFDISIKQLEIPLTFRIITKNQRWHFMGGASANFPLTLRATSRIELNADDFLKTFNLGYLTGIGFRFRKKAWGTVHLEMRYSQSLMHLTTSEDPVFSRLKSSHSTFTVVYFPPQGNP